jgi:phosphate transport system protein
MVLQSAGLKGLGASMPQQHIVKSFDAELDRLHEIVLDMGRLAGEQLVEALEALDKGDSVGARRTIEKDVKVDGLERQAEEQALRLLALRQPMAKDLRDIVSALKIVSHIERIADYAKNVAKRSIALGKLTVVPALSAIPALGAAALAMVKDIVDAYGAGDAEKAVEVWKRDQQLDNAYTALVRELLTQMVEDARTTAASIHFLSIAKNLERIGDHATDIAEDVYFLATGRRLDAERPKGDTELNLVQEPT